MKKKCYSRYTNNYKEDIFILYMQNRFHQECSLEKEVDVFMKRLPLWLLMGRRNKWVAVHGTAKVFGKNYEAVLEKGYKSFSPDSFLVRQISFEYLWYGKNGKPEQLYASASF